MKLKRLLPKIYRLQNNLKQGGLNEPLKHWKVLERYDIDPHNNKNTVLKKIQLMRRMTEKEKGLLARLYTETMYMMTPSGYVNSSKRKAVLDWFINILAKKYNVPKNWLFQHPGMILSRGGQSYEQKFKRRKAPGWLGKQIKIDPFPERPANSNRELQRTYLPVHLSRRVGAYLKQKRIEKAARNFAPGGIGYLITRTAYRKPASRREGVRTSSPRRSGRAVYKPATV
jgi:hypothetical protein